MSIGAVEFSRALVVSQMMSLVVLLTGCGSDGPTSPPPPSATTGSIRIVASTTGVRLDTDGYTVVLDGGNSRAIASDGTLTYAEVSPGAHSVEISGASSNCKPPSSSVNVTVTAGQSTDATFPVQCGYLVYVGNLGSDDLTVVETVTHSVVETVSVGNVSDGVGASPDGSLIYFTQVMFGNPDRTIGVVSTETNTLVTQIDMPGTPWLVDVTPDGTLLLVLHLDGALSFVDTSTNMEIKRLDFGSLATSTPDMAISRDGTRVYVTDLSAGRLFIVDIPNRRVLRSVSITDAWAVTVSPDGNRVFVSKSQNEIVALDPVTDAILATSADLLHVAQDMVIHPDGSELYVPLRGDLRVAILDPTTLNEIGSVSINDPGRIEITADGLLLYTTVGSAREVAAISTETRQVIGRTPVGLAPRDLAITPR